MLERNKACSVRLYPTNRSLLSSLSYVRFFSRSTLAISFFVSTTGPLWTFVREPDRLCHTQRQKWTRFMKQEWRIGSVVELAMSHCCSPRLPMSGLKNIKDIFKFEIVDERNILAFQPGKESETFCRKNFLYSVTPPLKLPFLLAKECSFSQPWTSWWSVFFKKAQSDLAGRKTMIWEKDMG